MTWYNDPDPTGGPPPFASQPTGMPASQVPPVGGGDLPTSPSNGSNRTVLWVVAGVGALMAMMTVGTGAFVLLSGRTEELRMSDYAEKICDEVIQPWVNDLEEFFDTDEWDDLEELDDSSPTSDGRMYVRFMTEFADQMDPFIDDIESFNTKHRLKGSDGDDLYDELNDFVEEGRAGLDQVREFLSDADPSDGGDLMEELEALNDSSSSSSSKLTDSDIGEELNEELGNVDDDCTLD